MLTTIREWLGRRACAKDNHAPLVWYRRGERHLPITNPAMEIVAVTWSSIMRYVGFCPRCGRAVEWSSDDPRTPAERRAQRQSRKRALSGRQERGE